MLGLAGHASGPQRRVSGSDSIQALACLGLVSRHLGEFSIVAGTLRHNAMFFQSGLLMATGVLNNE
jgi:hypothetical protein